jgi:Tfp pilus assembly protein PilV
MRGIRGGSETGRGGRRASEAGFAMVEVMVSAVLLIVLAMATLPLLDQAGQRAGANKSRSIAASLAQADQDRMHQMAIDELANFSDQRTKTVEGVAFTIRSTTQWVRDASGFVTCAVDPAKAEYLKITSTVTWPKMLNTKPVVVEGFVAPGVTALGPSKGTLTVKLQNAQGGPQPGIPVTAGGLAGVTDAGGCYVFAQLNAGPNTVTYNAPGYVDRKHVQNSTQTVSVAGGATSQVTDMYDKAAVLRASFMLDNTPAGTASAWGSMTAVTGGTGVTSPVQKTATAAAQMDSQGLFPTTAGYGVFAGKQPTTCAMNEPTQYRADYWSGSTSPYKTSYTNTYSTTAVPTAVNVFLHRLNFTVTNVASGYRIWVKPTGAGCEDPGKQALSLSGTTGTYSVDLPWGSYTVCVDNGVGGSSARKRDMFLSGSPLRNTPQGSASPNVPTTDLTGNVASFNYTAATPANGTC